MNNKYNLLYPIANRVHLLTRKKMTLELFCFITLQSEKEFGNRQTR